MGIAGAPLGGWLATRVFHVHTLNGFFNLSTWLTAIAGAEIMLLASYLLTGGERRARSPAPGQGTRVKIADPDSVRP